MVWEGEAEDNQLVERQSFWEIDCPFCPDEILAEELVNCKLGITKMIHGVRLRDGSPKNRKMMKLDRPATPTVVTNSHAVVGGEDFISNLGWLEGITGLKKVV